MAADTAEVGMPSRRTPASTFHLPLSSPSSLENAARLVLTEMPASVSRSAAAFRKDGTESVEERYFLTSLIPDASLFAIVVRRHWHVENLLHWVLDVTFKEDSQRTRNKVALENLSLVRRFVISILKILKSWYKLSYNKIRRKIGRRFDKEIPVIFATLKKLYDEGNT